MVDSDESVVCWVRLHVGELPILWNSGGQHYNPDFLVIDVDSIHWIVEVKMDKEMTSADVQGKREAAARWANHVSANAEIRTTWRYLLVAESDVTMARGSWSSLRQIGM